MLIAGGTFLTHLHIILAFRSENQHKPTNTKGGPALEKVQEKWTELVDALFHTSPTASAFQYLAINAEPSYISCDDINVHEVEICTTAAIPPTLTKIVQQVSSAAQKSAYFESRGGECD